MTTIQVHEQHGAAGASPRRPRMAWWRAPFSADTWRRTLYVLLVAPVSVVSVPLVLIGGHRTAARWQRGLARRYLGVWIGEPASAGTAARTIAHALLSGPGRKFVGGYAAADSGPVWWAARRSRRSSRSLVVYFQLKGRAAKL